MSVVQRVQDVLLNPKGIWPVIAAEPADAAQLMRGYLGYLAAVPALASLVGGLLFGGGGQARNSLAGLLALAVLGFALSLIGVVLLALIVDALAPRFGAVRDPAGALKLVAYSSTAGFLGGIFQLVPGLAVLGVLASLYSIHLVRTGVPVLMHCPAERATAYTVAIVVCAVGLTVVLGAAAASLVPRAGAREVCQCVPAAPRLAQHRGAAWAILEPLPPA